jgi:hypothetical protein
MLQKNPRQYVSRFPVRIGSRIRIVFADDIEWIAEAGDYAELHGSGRSSAEVDRGPMSEGHVVTRRFVLRLIFGGRALGLRLLRGHVLFG